MSTQHTDVALRSTCSASRSCCRSPVSACSAATRPSSSALYDSSCSRSAAAAASFSSAAACVQADAGTHHTALQLSASAACSIACSGQSGLEGARHEPRLRSSASNRMPTPAAIGCYTSVACEFNMVSVSQLSACSRLLLEPQWLGLVLG